MRAPIPKRRIRVRKQSESSSGLLTVKQFAERYPAFSEGALRKLIFCSKERTSSIGQISSNGFGKSICRIGSRVYIDTAVFFRLARSPNR